MNLKALSQSITYWAPANYDGFGGKAFASPVTVYGRWEDAFVEFSDSSGQTQISNALVYLRSDVELEGYLFNGVSVVANPTTLKKAFPISQFSKIPNLRNLGFERKAFL